MTQQTLHIDDLTSIAHDLEASPWLVACLCAAWCDTCQAYRKNFETVRASHPDKVFAWIDIEDHSNIVEDLDIENFPTILIEYRGKVLFLGTMLPDANLVHKLINSYTETIKNHSVDSIHRSIQSSNQDIPPDWSMTEQLTLHFKD